MPAWHAHIGTAFTLGQGVDFMELWLPECPFVTEDQAERMPPRYQALVRGYELPVLLLLMHAFGIIQVSPVHSLEYLMLQFKDAEGLWDLASLQGWPKGEIVELHQFPVYINQPVFFPSTKP